MAKHKWKISLTKGLIGIDINDIEDWQDFTTFELILLRSELCKYTEVISCEIRDRTNG